MTDLEVIIGAVKSNKEILQYMMEGNEHAYEQRDGEDRHIHNARAHAYSVGIRALDNVLQTIKALENRYQIGGHQ